MSGGLGCYYTLMEETRETTMKTDETIPFAKDWTPEPYEPDDMLCPLCELTWSMCDCDKD